MESPCFHDEPYLCVQAFVQVLSCLPSLWQKSIKKNYLLHRAVIVRLLNRGRPLCLTLKMSSKIQRKLLSSLCILAGRPQACSLPGISARGEMEMLTWQIPVAAQKEHWPKSPGHPWLQRKKQAISKPHSGTAVLKKISRENPVWLLWAFFGFAPWLPPSWAPWRTGPWATQGHALGLLIALARPPNPAGGDGWYQRQVVARQAFVMALVPPNLLCPRFPKSSVITASYHPLATL